MDRQKVSSSNLKSVGYDSKGRVLEVEFKSGGVYRYYGISPQRYRAFNSADSLGTYLNDRIKNGYEVNKVEPRSSSKLSISANR